MASFIRILNGNNLWGLVFIHSYQIDKVFVDSQDSRLQAHALVVELGFVVAGDYQRPLEPGHALDVDHVDLVDAQVRYAHENGLADPQRVHASRRPSSATLDAAWPPSGCCSR